MWCWPWHAPNRNLVAGLMKSLFRLFAVSCTYCSATIGALTSVNNARLFGLGPRWAKRSEDFSRVPKLKSRSDCDCPNRICFSGRTREMASLIFQRHPTKNVGTNGIARVHTRWGNVARRDSPDAREFAGRMLSIHSENCRNSISRREKSSAGPGGNVPGQFRPEVPRQPVFTRRSCA